MNARLQQLRLERLGRSLAKHAFDAAESDLARCPKLPPRCEFTALELDLGRALSVAEESLLMRTYRGELQSLSAQHELAQIGGAS